MFWLKTKGGTRSRPCRRIPMIKLHTPCEIAEYQLFCAALQQLPGTDTLVHQATAFKQDSFVGRMVVGHR